MSLTPRALQMANLALYAGDVLSGPPVEPFRGRFMIARHHEDWAEIANRSKRSCIIAARGHGKSEFWTLAYPIWLAERFPRYDPGVRIFSATQDQATEKLLKIQKEIETNPKLKHLLPKNMNKARWSGTAMELANGFTIFASGYGTKVRGGHPYALVVDDGLNDETAFSERVRQKQNDYFFNSLSNMPPPDGELRVVGTPFHPADLYGELANTKGYIYKEFPAWRLVEGPNGQKIRVPLWPEYWPLEKLDAKVDEIKPLRFSREYLCIAISSIASLYPRELFAGEKVERFGVRLGMGAGFWDKYGITRYAGIDLGISAEMGLDYTVIFTIGVDARGNHWVVDIERWQGLGFQEQLSRIKASWIKNRPEKMFIEANQAQSVFHDEAIRTCGAPLEKWYTTKEKNYLESGIPSHRIHFENNKIRIPRGDERSIELTDAWAVEMGGWTIQEGKVVSIAEHDDIASAFHIAEEAIKACNFSFSFHEEDGDEEALAELDKEDAADADDPWGDWIPGARARSGDEGYARLLEPEDVDDELDDPRTKNGSYKKTGPRAGKAGKDETKEERREREQREREELRAKEREWAKTIGVPKGRDILNYKG